MIISASRRTDIPAFYWEWFQKRLQEQYVLVRNPLNLHQVSRISLRPEVVDGLVFWTKIQNRCLSGCQFWMRMLIIFNLRSMRMLLT